MFTYPDIYTVFDHEPFYVGKGTGNRWRRHVTKTEIQSNRHDLKRNTILAIKAAGYSEVPHVKLFVSTDEMATYEEECKTISAIGLKIDQLGPLTNILAGGSGGPRSGILNPHYGIPNSPETRLKISKALKGKYSGERCVRFGVPWTREAKDKLSKIHTGKSIDVVTQRKMNLAKTKFRFIISTPEGTLDITYSLNAYARYKHLDSSCLLKTAKRLRKQHKGFVVTDVWCLPDNWRENSELLGEYYALEKLYA